MGGTDGHTNNRCAGGNDVGLGKEKDGNGITLSYAGA